MDKKLLNNAAVSVLQVLVSGIVLFLLFRFLLIELGIESIGLWAVTLGVTALFNVGNLGFSGSVVKFIAKQLAINDTIKVTSIIETATLSVCIMLSVIILLLYPLIELLLHSILIDDALEVSLKILPLTSLSFFFLAISSVFLAGLDGCQRFDIKSYLIIFSSLLFLFSAYFLVSKYGVIGLALAYLVQSFVLMSLGWLLLRSQIFNIPFVPYRWSRKMFLEMYNYSLNFQVITISQMLCEPIVKILLGQYGGLSMTGYYEMAYRMVTQIRAVVATANQVITPYIAEQYEKTGNQVNEVYRAAYGVTAFVSLLIFSLLVGLLPFISEVWTGEYEIIFVIIATVLIVSFFINTLVTPAYFGYLGIGQLKWVVIGQVVIFVISGGLGTVLGEIFGGWGVIVGYSFAITLGSCLIVVAYHLENKISLLELFPKENLWLYIMAPLGSLGSWVGYLWLRDYFDINLAIMGCLLIYAAIIIRPLWKHAFRKRLWSLLRAAL